MIKLGEERGTIDVDGITGDSGITTIFNLTGGKIEFTCGTILSAYRLRASANHNDRIDNTHGNIVLAHRESYISDEMIYVIDDLLDDYALGIVSLPFLKAVQGTILEGRCISVIYDKERSGKIALCRKFAF